MHSCTHRHWITDGNNIESPPDITIAVGSAQQGVKFMAHKVVLSKFSGYFKTLFSSYDGAETRIANIGSHTFAYLLSFMYTGRLELNPLNEYEVYAASSLLRINEALHLCEQYLIHKQQQQYQLQVQQQQQYRYTISALQSSPVVRPIPRRNAPPHDDHHSRRRLPEYQPLRLHDERGSIFRPVGSAVAMAQSVADSNAVASVRVEEGTEKLSTMTEAGDRGHGAKAPPDKAAVVDIACCDGPIKFHRVANRFYDPKKATASASKEDPSFHTEAALHRKREHRLTNDLRSRLGLSGCQFSNNDTATFQAIGLASTSTKLKADVKYGKKIENLPCYPCKTCGSKFPSYYFVHKHRKLHHRNMKEFFE